VAPFLQVPLELLAFFASSSIFSVDDLLLVDILTRFLLRYFGAYEMIVTDPSIKVICDSCFRESMR
jgi:hypothetical protein